MIKPATRVVWNHQVGLAGNGSKLQALIEEFEEKITEYAAERAEEERTAETSRTHADQYMGELD